MPSNIRRGTISLGYEIGDTFRSSTTDTGRGVAHEDLEKIFNRFAGKRS